MRASVSRPHLFVAGDTRRCRHLLLDILNQFSVLFFNFGHGLGMPIAWMCMSRLSPQSWIASRMEKVLCVAGGKISFCGTL